MEVAVYPLGDLKHVGQRQQKRPGQHQHNSHCSSGSVFGTVCQHGLDETYSRAGTGGFPLF